MDVHTKNTRKGEPHFAFSAIWNAWHQLKHPLHKGVRKLPDLTITCKKTIGLVAVSHGSSQQKVGKRFGDPVRGPG
jgi:hypothetical protein